MFLNGWTRVQVFTVLKCSISKACVIYFVHSVSNKSEMSQEGIKKFAFARNSREVSLKYYKFETFSTYFTEIRERKKGREERKRGNKCSLSNVECFVRYCVILRYTKLHTNLYLFVVSMNNVGGE